MIITELFAYKIIFVIEILFSMHLLSFYLPKKKYPVCRYILTILSCLLIAIIFPLFKNVSYSWWYSSIMFFILFTCCAISLYFVYNISIQNIFLISITAYTSQHLAYQAYNVLTTFLSIEEKLSFISYGDIPLNVNLTYLNIISFSILLIVYVIIYTIVFIIFNERINKDEAKISNFSIVLISGLILLIDIIINSIIIYSDKFQGKEVSIIICTYNILCCLMVLFLLFNILNIKQLKTELTITSQLLNKAEEQYKQNKENVDLINIKCHDLKHQIRNFGNKANISNETVKELENIINIYDSNIKTNNDALDLILTEKSLLCQKKNINLKCFADCSKLNFITEADLYSLFGNMIDNAIEAVTKIEDVNKRSISLIVRNALSCISIFISNYYEGKIILDNNGMPKTTKLNNGYHGYGLKSIKLIVDKYNGDFKIDIKDNIFMIQILFTEQK
ncbi:MAG: ATP-binding protein [Bacilli bacterium]